MIISLIVAMDHNGLIGANNGLPWRLPDDMRWFVEQTMGKPVIMGRKTYDSIPAKFKPLRGRHNIIVTRNPHYEAPGCTIAHSLPAALVAAGDVPEAIIGGGAQIYAEALPLTRRLYLTLVDGEFHGDAYFPAIDPGEWREIWRQVHEPDGRHAHRFTWLIWERP
ncbi:MAG: dihydrofolate reductase [Chloroflexi bacterium]|nr:dihydrofolate reductase [Ardenticatenaceae bacterium]MBL1128523.1 dihydrofolate reductase [Chloroflexota bacterium]NOG34601.1 dihydrofolate reductase [Chloroflexota bacterium]GIK56681.1 MAG: dihydrofolate reductase [Chloroflexota bacterium]